MTKIKIRPQSNGHKSRFGFSWLCFVTIVAGSFIEFELLQQWDNTILGEDTFFEKIYLWFWMSYMHSAVQFHANPCALFRIAEYNFLCTTSCNSDNCSIEDVHIEDFAGVRNICVVWLCERRNLLFDDGLHISIHLYCPAVPAGERLKLLAPTGQSWLNGRE